MWLVDNVHNCSIYNVLHGIMSLCVIFSHSSVDIPTAYVIQAALDSVYEILQLWIKKSRPGIKTYLYNITYSFNLLKYTRIDKDIKI